MKNKMRIVTVARTVAFASIPLFGWLLDAWEWLAKACNGAGFA
jgi:hypothetical protein